MEEKAERREEDPRPGGGRGGGWGGFGWVRDYGFRQGSQRTGLEIV